MEDNSSLFSLSVDPVSREHLTETAKWARFLAILGFVFLALLIVMGITTSMTLSRIDSGEFGSRGVGAVAGTATIVVYVIMAIIYFFPLLYLLRFANAMRAALDANDQEQLNASFQNLKSCFRYVGIVTIIALAFMLIGLIMAIAGAAVSS